ncbi:hypothetical protein C8N46_102319 [Kordia periserrulae]|uniref:Uncharacterized protein n=1 Tax=Kordia periserrulae TaxID=701523 RepID=A0A2T6C3N6_9FLAO|nr:hypothetical protein [Kordia periserrulae]PTX62918.1 hypothetical protein C8N46_102319 [Kordia periserrulae]
MKKQNQIKLSLSKNTVSNLEATVVKGGISGGACQPAEPLPDSIGCPPRSVPYTACQISFELSCICSR